MHHLLKYDTLKNNNNNIEGRYVRLVGLHLRLEASLSALFEKALRLQMPIVQCFLIPQGSKKYIEFTQEEVLKCKALASNFKYVYLHASYWVNLAGRRNNGWRAFNREIELASKLGFTHIIIHPGSATGCNSKEEGIELLSKALNKIMEQDLNITIVLENTAHAKLSVGGDLEDFKKLLTLLTKPEKVAFCLDTAHAHSYGYDVVTPEGQAAFFESTQGWLKKEQIALIHLNETKEKRGSLIDKHVLFGKGLIGDAALQSFINNDFCKDIPIILEAPALDTEDEEKDLVAVVQKWSV